MTEIEPEPCMGCMTPIYPGHELCEECEKKMWAEEQYLQEQREDEQRRWVAENGEDGHG